MFGGICSAFSPHSGVDSLLVTAEIRSVVSCDRVSAQRGGVHHTTQA